MTKAKAAPGKPGRVDDRVAPARRSRTKMTPTQKGEHEDEPLNKHWRVYFLAALAETSNVTAACATSGASPSRAYKVRREDPAFARAWRDALFEGYENLEMEVLHRLRSGEADRKYDNANAIRLLAAHRETIARERARRDNRDEQAVLDSIDAMIDEMRERSAANAALLAEDDDGDGADHGED
jgi:hypothetical protein